MRPTGSFRTLIVLLLAAVMGLAASAPPALASSPKAHSQRLTAPKSDVRRLKHKVRVQRRALADASDQIAALRAALDVRTAERDRALARAAALQGKLAAKRYALELATEQVRREVAHSEYVLREAGVGYEHEAIVALAAMTYVVGHVSAPGYGYMNTSLGVRPEPTAESVLTAGSGICGHAALTFAAIIKRFKLPVRSVQFYYADGVNNHIAAEVYYGGAWHYYDPTWGAFYADATGRVLSIDDARTHPDPESLLQQDGTLLWRSILSMAGVPPLGAETSPDTRVEIDKQPFSGR
jgi:hypothetical protein